LLAKIVNDDAGSLAPEGFSGFSRARSRLQKVDREYSQGKKTPRTSRGVFDTD